MEGSYQERQTAIKIKIKTVLKGKFFVEDGLKPNYLLTSDNQKVSRLNLIGVVLTTEKSGEKTNIILDDGTGKISLQLFEKSKKEVGPGEVLLVIGKVRVFNQEKYVAPEILKKIDSAWLKVRHLELEERALLKKEETKTEEEKDKDEGVFSYFCEVIKNKDVGDGVLIEEVVEEIGLNTAEEILEIMIKKGLLFQNRPGKIKVL